MSSYRFYYKGKASAEIVRKLGQQSAFSVRLSFDGSRFRMKSKMSLRHPERTDAFQHPLKRIFAGRIKDTNGGAVITGSFRYPYIMTAAFICFLGGLLYGNISVFVSGLSVAKKLAVTAIFSFMYLIVGFFFKTGRTFYYETEKFMISFLEHL